MTQDLAETHNSFAVFEHEKRREWGLSVLAWESKNKRGYVFENGQLRVLAEPFYAMMREVDRPFDEVQALFKCLKPELDAARAEQGTMIHSAKPPAKSMSFDDQIAVFRAAYPGGFDDARWIEQVRGTNAKKRGVAHRDPAIADVKEKLSARALKTRIADQAFHAIHEDLCTVLRQTDLVPAAELAPIQSADPSRQRAIALMVADLLHGKGAYGPRFDHFLTAFQQTLGKAAGWQLATTWTALLEPSEHVSVRPTALRAQAKWMAPRLSIPKLPNAASYLRCQAMAKLICTKLTEHGEKPRDMLDVLDFVRLTTRPDARQRLTELRRALP